MPSPRAEIITRRTYSRPLDEEGKTFETWEQIVDRVIDHQYWLWQRAKGAPLSKGNFQELDDLRNLMLKREALTSGRTLWLGGTEVSKKRESSMFNCSFEQISTVHDVVDAIWLLLQGCGVGFKPVVGILNGFAQPVEIEVVNSTRTEADGKGVEGNITSLVDGVWTLRVGDSAEAWAKAVGKIFAMKTPVKKVVFDFSEIRPAGVRLKGYGWVSSGDKQISKAFVAIAKILSQASGRLLTQMELLDVLNWLGTILSSRRSAEIAVVEATSPEVDEFIVAKKDWWLHDNAHRQQSNNSILFYHRPTKWELSHIFQKIQDSGGSEPGFINAVSATKRAPWFKGVNPCLVPNTLVATVCGGLQRIGNLSVANIVDGKGDTQEVIFKKTGVQQPILTVLLSDGTEVEATPTHNFITESGNFVAAQDLEPGTQLKTADITGRFGHTHEPENAYRDAWLIADGTWYNSHKNSKLDLYGEKSQYKDLFGKPYREEEKKTVINFLGVPYQDKDKVPDYVLSGDEATVKSFVRGYLQSDGHVGLTSKGWTVQVASIHKNFLIEFYQLLKLLGVRGHISEAHEEGYRNLPDGRGGYKEYFCQRTYRLTVSNPMKLLEWYMPEVVKRGAYNLKDKPITVVSVTDHGKVSDVYCAGVPSTNSFDLGTVHSGNCAEICLGDKSFCNLVEVDLGKFNGRLEDLHSAMYLAARANYRQTCVDLNDGILQRTWHELNEFLRLCGVGATGIVRWEHLDDPLEWQDLRLSANEGAKSMADELGLPRAKLVTTVKPSGTLGKIMDTTEGVHKPLGKYIFNNVKFGIHDPLIPILQEANYNVFKDPSSNDAMLVTLPVSYEDVSFDVVDGTEVNIESAVTQLNRYKVLMDNYVDHNCSITISYSPDEVPAIVDWLLENWDTYVGVSFIYRNDPTKTAADLGYLYLPQEVVTKEMFDEYTSKLLPINLDSGNTLDEFEQEGCATGACPVR